MASVTSIEALTETSSVYLAVEYNDQEFTNRTFQSKERKLFRTEEDYIMLIMLGISLICN